MLAFHDNSNSNLFGHANFLYEHITDYKYHKSDRWLDVIDIRNTEQDTIGELSSLSISIVSYSHGHCIYRVALMFDSHTTILINIIIQTQL